MGQQQINNNQVVTPNPEVPLPSEGIPQAPPKKLGPCCVCK